jgi:hypothetical protein
MVDWGRGYGATTPSQHGTDDFTSPPKEGMLWIFSPEKSDGFGRVRTCGLSQSNLEPGASRSQDPLPTCQRVYSIIFKFERVRFSFICNWNTQL